MKIKPNLIDFIYPEELENNKILSLDENHDLKIILEFIKKHNINTNHPLFLNQLFGNTDELSIIADTYIAENNTSMYTYEMSSAFTIMELEVTKKLKKLIGFKECTSFFLPGGSLSNIEAINTARYYYNTDIKEKGNIKDLIIITSDQAHYSIEKGCALLGLGTENLIKVKTDSQGKIIIIELEKIIAKLKENNKNPFIIIGTAGTTVLGSFDNISELVKISKKNNIWLHIDGSFGGGVIFNKMISNNLLTDLNQVNSFCFNPHKMLNLNLQSSVLLINKEEVTSNYAKVNYLFNSDKFYDNNYDTGNKYFMCGRKPDIFKFWLVWKMKGDIHFSNIINNVFEKSIYFKEKLLENTEKFDVINSKYNSLTVCFIVKNSNIVEIKKRLIEQNLAMITYQKIKNYPNFFRICFVNSNCYKEDIDNLFTILVNI
jgi:glutamate/tyrosine decarboxylase-like PLP-dependent enzyme